MRLFLLRHFPTESIAGEFNPPLSARGEAQGDELKYTIRRLAPDGFRLIVVSPWLRTRQSLERLQLTSSSPIIESPHAERRHDRLQEFDELIGDALGDVLIVGHEHACKYVRLRYYERLGIPHHDREGPFLCGRLAVVDFTTRTVTNY